MRQQQFDHVVFECVRGDRPDLAGLLHDLGRLSASAQQFAQALRVIAGRRSTWVKTVYRLWTSKPKYRMIGSLPA
jgi:hypothetical protein